MNENTEDNIWPAEPEQTDLRRRRKSSTGSRSGKQLACLSCRRKKVKTACHVPEFDDRKRTHTRKLIDSLKAENEKLRAQLAEHRKVCLLNSDHDDSTGTPESDTSVLEEVSPGTESNSSKSDNMIVRLCGGQRQLNSDRVGRLRFFGPTSSLHLMESVTSSILIGRDTSSGSSKPVWQDDFPLEMQNYLLDLYWTYLHQVLPCIHKEAFLRDMASGDTRYCSTLLMYCILTRAAAISNEPGLRALALADDPEDEPPYLVRKCVQLLETELDRPGITTSQSLQLMSEMHCAISHDTKGWMYAGGAGRLAYELGLHSSSESLGSSLSEIDHEVRKIVFWSAFNLDRSWALYLGRPLSIKIEDVEVKKPGDGDASFSDTMLFSAAWTNLLEIIGLICEVLNGFQAPHNRLHTLNYRLLDWRAKLDPTIAYHAKQSPAVFLLHMQYAAAMILLHRPGAQFGKGTPCQTSTSETSRQICVDNAVAISQYLQEYTEQHGSVLTMSWIALHIIATASTTLIANIAERRSGATQEPQLEALRKCLDSLSELEKSHTVTRRVRKVIQQAIRLLNLDATVKSSSGSSNGFLASSVSLMTPLSYTAPDTSTTMGDFPFLGMLPNMSQFDMLNSFESYFS
ncbi:hypothetical protein CC79DRAFT_1370615 [Sarocladium strictum]